ncbi:hypothetical protein NEM89_07395 [Escherichia coli]|nr:hypothetical protein [Escherichia coli]
MNSLLILLYVVVWRVCTILRVIAPVSAVRAWCEYQLEGMAILRDAYSSLAKAAGMQNEAFEYLKGIARHLGYKSGELMRLRAWQRLGITPEPDDETEPSLVYVQLWDTGEALGWLLYDLEQENIPAPGVQARQALGSLMALGREINHEIWTDSISTGKLTAGADACFARHDMM